MYHYEYMDDWKKFNETSLPEKEDFYRRISLSLSDDVFGNFRYMCINISELDAAKLLSAPGLAWQATFKKAKVKLELLTDFDMNGRKSYKKRNMSFYL